MQFQIVSERTFSTGHAVNLDLNPVFFFGNFKSYSSGFYSQISYPRFYRSRDPYI